MIVVFAFSMQEVPEKRAGDEFFTSLVSPEEYKSFQPPSRAVPPAKRVPGQRSQALPSPPKPERTPETDPGKKSEMSAVSPADPQGKPDYPSGIQKAPAPSAVPPAPGVPPQTHGPRPSLREQLFDRNVITELAKRHQEDEEKKKQKKSFTFDATDYKFLIYNQKLKERIESIWKYPPEAASRGIYGDLIIRFTILKNGRLGKIELVRTSGHEDLDDAAMKALKDAAPFWPIPNEWEMESYTIVGHFVYTIYGYYVR